MTIPNSNLLIELSVTKFSNKKNIIKIIRKYSDRPIGQIYSELKIQKSIFEIELLKDQFYAGWKTLSFLVGDLLLVGASVKIIVNHEVVDLSFINKLKCKMTNIKRGDIY
ncbi:hypothetical protein MNBD_GAMMA10-1546 [hydrothermal vent metagenome]|uniref:Uncharacterized protein n=1 Tax=hydrothermal vent metagenome TaxID=652676 RepID=A0A3B0Y6U7_9ZZZZ